MLTRPTSSGSTKVSKRRKNTTKMLENKTDFVFLLTDPKLRCIQLFCVSTILARHYGNKQKQLYSCLDYLLPYRVIRSLFIINVQNY